jgi:hypothetical protein
VTTVKPAWLVAAVSSASMVMTACHAGTERRERAKLSDPARQVDLFVVLCDGGTPCDDFDRKSPTMVDTLHLELADCLGSETAALFGSWSVAGADSRLFAWEAEVRYGGVFPAFHHLGANLGCFDEHPPAHSPDVGIRSDPDGFDWAQLEGDDVFIPFRGQATLDHALVARARLDTGDAAAAPRVTVSVEGPDATPVAHPGLGPGDSFSWGGYRAAVVRIIPPQEALVGAIGWVEIRLSGGTPRRAP